jgi:hypothetical protein
MRAAFALRIISGKIILNFEKRLRAFLNLIFTDGVVKENGICSAAFCESAAQTKKREPSEKTEDSRLFTIFSYSLRPFRQG